MAKKKRPTACEGRKLTKGPRGGHYYVTPSGYKKYCKVTAKKKTTAPTKKKKKAIARPRPRPVIAAAQPPPQIVIPKVIPKVAPIPIVSQARAQAPKVLPPVRAANMPVALKSVRLDGADTRPGMMKRPMATSNILQPPVIARPTPVVAPMEVSARVPIPEDVRQTFFQTFPYEEFKKYFHDNINDFHFTENDFLGGGIAGRVYRATYTGLSPRIPKVVALKFFFPQQDLREVEPYVMSRIMNNPQLRSSQVLMPIYGGGLTRDMRPFMVYKLMPGGSLKDYMGQRNFNISDAEAVRLMMDIMDGVHILHIHNIAHLDLHEGNVMVDNGRAVIGDFGFACTSDPANPCPNFSLYKDLRSVLTIMGFITSGKKTFLQVSIFNKAKTLFHINENELTLAIISRNFMDVLNEFRFFQL